MKTYEVGALLEAANQRDTKKVKEILQDTTYQVDEVDTEATHRSISLFTIMTLRLQKR